MVNSNYTARKLIDELDAKDIVAGSPIRQTTAGVMRMPFRKGMTRSEMAIWAIFHIMAER